MPIALIPLAGIDDVAPIEVSALERMDQCFSGCDVGCDRDVVYVAESEQSGFVRFSWVGADRITKIEQQVDFIAGDAGRDLLVPTLPA